jgi:hypothetical protein
MVKFTKFQASLVKLSGSSSIDVLVGEIVRYVQQKIKLIYPDKIDPSLLRFLCNLVKNLYRKKNAIDSKVDKKKIVIDVYIILKRRANNNDDKIILNKLIEDFHSSGQILKIADSSYWFQLLKKQLKKKT